MRIQKRVIKNPFKYFMHLFFIFMPLGFILSSIQGFISPPELIDYLKDQEEYKNSIFFVLADINYSNSDEALRIKKVTCLTFSLHDFPRYLSVIKYREANSHGKQIEINNNDGFKNFLIIAVFYCLCLTMLIKYSASYFIRFFKLKFGIESQTDGLQ